MGTEVSVCKGSDVQQSTFFDNVKNVQNNWGGGDLGKNLHFFPGHPPPVILHVNDVIVLEEFT